MYKFCRKNRLKYMKSLNQIMFMCGCQSVHRYVYFLWSCIASPSCQAASSLEFKWPSGSPFPPSLTSYPLDYSISSGCEIPLTWDVV